MLINVVPEGGGGYTVLKIALQTVRRAVNASFLEKLEQFARPESGVIVLRG